MIDIPLSENFRTWCHTYALGNLVQSKTREPGTLAMQTSGVIGQNAVLWLLGRPLMKHGQGYDGGYDLVVHSELHSVLVDVKTQTRKVTVRDGMVANFVDDQRRLNCQAYIFCSYNWVKEIVTICGWAPKRYLFERAEFHPKGQLRYRSDGTSFENRYDNWEMPISKLYPCRSAFELQHEICRVMADQMAVVEA